MSHEHAQHRLVVKISNALYCQLFCAVMYTAADKQRWHCPTSMLVRFPWQQNCKARGSQTTHLHVLDSIAAIQPAELSGMAPLSIRLNTKIDTKLHDSEDNAQEIWNNDGNVIDQTAKCEPGSTAN